MKVIFNKSFLFIFMDKIVKNAGELISFKEPKREQDNLLLMFSDLYFWTCNSVVTYVNL